MISVLFTCNSESTACVSDHLTHRRDQVIPAPTMYAFAGRKAIAAVSFFGAPVLSGQDYFVG